MEHSPKRQKQPKKSKVYVLQSPNSGMKMPKLTVEKGTKGPVHATRGILGVSYKSPNNSKD